MVWLKLAHVAAVAVWCAALICLPGLSAHPADCRRGAGWDRRHRRVRFVYVSVMSPAAFVAIATGTGLIFARDVWAPWMGIKMVFVGGLTVSHILAGFVIGRVFEEGRRYPGWRRVAAVMVSGLLMTGVIVLVLAKPRLPPLLPAEMHEPKGLQRLLGFNPGDQL